MRKILTIIAVVFCFITLSTNASASSFKIEDSAIENLFSKATTSNISIMFDGFESSNSTAIVKEKSAAAALVIDFFLGGLGIHRFYLGTKAMTGVGYILTCGGIFGLVPLVDLIVIAVNFDDISNYVDNPKFFMW